MMEPSDFRNSIPSSRGGYKRRHNKKKTKEDQLCIGRIPPDPFPFWFYLVAGVLFFLIGILFRSH